MTSDTRSLIAAARDGDPEAMDRLVRGNMGLVKSIALRFRSRAELEDLIQIGTIGLIKAIRGFSFDRETVLSTYAVPLITGEIKRLLRDDGPIKVSRGLKKRGRDLSAARAARLARTGTEPSLSEIAAECGCTVEEAAEALDSVRAVVSFSSPAGEKTVEELIGSDCVADICENLALRQAVARLSPEEREVVSCRYYKGMSQQQTGEVLGVSQVRISRLEKKILSKLRSELM